MAGKTDTPAIFKRRFLGNCLAGAAAAIIVFVIPSMARADGNNADELPQVAGYSIHFQSTFTPQGNFSFSAPYSGDQSLDARGQAQETATGTAYFGARIWNGGEVYFNPELFHGFGLRGANNKGTVGLAGFSNGEAQKGGRWDVDLEVPRLYFSQTIGLGGPTETIKDDLNQIAGTKDISRVTLTVGRFAVTDIFDGNAYAHDPRTQFQNWAIWDAGAFDYAADVKGYTIGGVAELNQKDWAIRAGYFLVPVRPNALELDTDITKRGSAVAEIENRYNLFTQPGKLRLLGFANTVFSGDYTDAVRLNPDAPDIIATRRDRTKYGFVVNAEQAVNANLGAFFRYSWNDGRTEISSFTDIQQSFSGGISLKGASWGRPDDTVGLAGVMNGLSPSARRYFTAGGTGLLIGDGTLSYAGEKIIEAYYLYAVNNKLAVTLDYQYVADPAYNSDRGPVSILGGRVRVQF